MSWPRVVLRRAGSAYVPSTAVAASGPWDTPWRADRPDSWWPLVIRQSLVVPDRSDDYLWLVRVVSSLLYAYDPDPAA